MNYLFPVVFFLLCAYLFGVFLVVVLMVGCQVLPVCPFVRFPISPVVSQGVAVFSVFPLEGFKVHRFSILPLPALFVRFLCSVVL